MNVENQGMTVRGAMLLMAAVMVARGSSFVFSKWLMDDMAPMNVLAVRFITAFVVLAAVFYRKLLTINRATFLRGALLGTAYTACMVAEMYGLRLIDAGTSSFIENSTVVIVPLYEAVLTLTSPGFRTVLSALIAFAGVGFLTVSGGFTINYGIILTIIAALLFGACIIMTDKMVETSDPVTIGVIQIGTMGVLSLILTLIIDEPRLPRGGTEWFMILMLALICSCFGFTFQPLAQKYIPAETAGVFTAVNPLSACILGIATGEEDGNIYKLIGGALIVAAVLLSVLKGEKG